MGAGQLEVRLDNESLVTLPTDYLQAGHVTHAYAISGHKAQGMTTDRALVLGDEFPLPRVGLRRDVAWAGREPALCGHG
ncbi:MAG: hypothetical protein H0U53_10080 [Actinobacteria bacterium]|nr:hypothetical protein [Actinomycetota bacterium]